MSEPKIYSKNYVSVDCAFTLSHGGTSAYLYDRDQGSQYISVGAASDATQITIQVDFKEGTTVVTRTFDRVILLNTNAKDPSIDYWNGSAWVNITSTASLAVDYKIFSFVAVSATKFRIQIQHTQSADQNKTLGELMVCALVADIGQEMDSYDQEIRQKSVEIALADGSIHRTIVSQSQNRSSKYGARARFSFITTDMVKTLQALRDSGAAFLWHPESDSRPDQIFYVHWVGAGRTRYVTTYKGAGHQIDMELKEV